MKPITSIVILTFAVLYSSAILSEEIAFPALIGKWHSEKPHSSGAMVSNDLTINQDQTFSGMASISGKAIWQYDGTVDLQGNQLTWRYLHSSIALPPDYTDTDTIISADSNSYTYKSEKSGETNSYQKIK
jgi:hypothetical protein